MILEELLQKRIFHTILILTCSVTSGFADTNILSKWDSMVAHIFYQKGLAYIEEDQIDSARYALLHAAKEYQILDLWHNYFDAIGKLANLYSRKREYQESLDFIDSVNQVHPEKLSKDFKSAFYYYRVIASNHLQLYNYTDALKYFSIIDELLKTNPYATAYNQYWNYYYRSVLFLRSAQFDQALKYTRRCLEYGTEYDLDEFQSFSVNNLGIIYRNLGEYDRALEYYTATLDEMKSIPEVQLTPVYNNLGRIHWYMGNYQKALVPLDYALDVLANYTREYFSIESVLINSKANVLIDLEEYDHASKILLEVLAREKEKFGEVGFRSAATMQSLGILNMRSGDLSNAETYFSKTLELTEGKYTTLKSGRNETFLFLGKNYTLMDRNEDALMAFQNGIRSLVVGFDPPDYLENPNPDFRITNKISLMKLLKKKTEVLLQQYAREEDPEFLKAANDANILAIGLLNQVRDNLYYGNSKLAISAEMKPLYEQSIEIAAILNNQEQKNTPNYSRILSSMEGSKAYLLNEALQESQMEGHSILPDSVSELIGDLHFQMKYYNNKILGLLTVGEVDSSELSKLETELHHLKAQFEKVKYQIAMEYPGYSAVRYESGGPNLEDIQGILEGGQLMIEYFVGDESAYALAIGSENIRFYDLGSADNISARMQSFTGNLQSKTAGDYQHDASVIYKYVLSDIVRDFPDHNTLIIIPDGILGYLPFDALVTSDIPDPDFSKLQYLLFDRMVMQHYSVSLYLNSNNIQVMNNNYLIGFAPGFDNQKETLLAVRGAVINDYSELVKLPLAEKEVLTISNLFDGTAVLGKQASEARFKDQGGKYEYLHVASHAIIDNENPQYSHLVFAQNDEEKEDGMLYAYELYGMTLHNDLVCLSACNTGVGKYFKGEGIMSLARSFMYAGASSVLMSFWAVADRSTFEIMESFYTELNEGSAKEEALHNAKLAYLRNADSSTANPYYWAGFIYLGNSERNSFKSSYTVIIVVFIIIVFVIVGRWRMQKTRSV